MRLRHVLPIAALTLALLPAGAVAATPESGELSDEKTTLKWNGEAASYGFSFMPETTIAACEAPFCDTYTFTVPEGLPAGSDVLVRATAYESSGFTDLFVTDPSGERNYSASGSGEPSAEWQFFNPAAGTYTVQVMTNAPVVLTTGQYGGRVELTIPEPDPVEEPAEEPAA